MPTLELKIPPPLVALTVAASMWLAHSYAPSLALSIPGREAMALALVVAGIVLALSGVIAFRKANTTVNPARPGATSTVVMTGVYRFTRNPMYLGMLLSLTGWAVFLANGMAFALLPVFVLYMNRFQIGPEERALGARFGSDFARYMQSIRRWL